jgi:hypothetical protein
MSDQLSAAAQAMGVPEPIVERSAHAWASAQGQSYEDVIAAWAGGETVAASAPAAEEPAPAEETPTETEAPPEEAPTEEPAAPAQPAAAQPAAAAIAPRPTAAPSRPPVLEAPADRPLVAVGGGVGVVVLVLLLGIFFPALPSASDEVRTSAIAYSETAQAGRDVYLRAGCASCHTQAVRSVVADVGAGPVALGDTNQVLGFRRIGPDLSNVGTRLDANQLQGVITGGSHPALPLSSAALDALVAFLAESAYPGSGGTGQ